MAAGVSLKAADVSAFKHCYLESLKKLYPAGLPEPSLLISTWLDHADLGEGLLEELDRLHPFGQGNSEPVFGLKGIVLAEAPQAFGEGNFRFRMPVSLGARRGIAGIAWRLGTAPEVGQKVDMAIRFSWNYWRDSRYPQATLVDWKPTDEL